VVHGDDLIDQIGLQFVDAHPGSSATPGQGILHLFGFAGHDCACSAGVFVKLVVNPRRLIRTSARRPFG